MDQPKDISIEECEKLGIVFPCNQMGNGEYRFRCMDKNNNWGYVLIEVPKNEGGWQNSHSHKGIIDTCIVQKGWIAVAILNNDNVDIKIYSENEMVSITPPQQHNVYVAGGTVYHTVKHGDCSLEKDWFASEILDEKTKSLSEQDILSFSKQK